MSKRKTNSRRRAHSVKARVAQPGAASPYPTRYTTGIYWLAALSAAGVCGAALWFSLGAWNRDDSTQNRSSDTRVTQASTSATSGQAVTPVVSAITLAPADRSSQAGLSPADQLVKKQNVQADDWQTEVLSEAAIDQLARLQRLCEGTSPIDAQALAPLVAEDVSCTHLRPRTLDEIYRDGQITVRRPPDGKIEVAARFVGPAGMADALNQLLSALGAAAERHTKFKLFRIRQEQDHFVTHVRYEASSHDAQRGRQQTALWSCRWTVPQSSRPARLTHLALLEYEEIEIAIPHGRLFVDCTKSVLGGNDAYHQQVLPGIPHWLTRIPTEFIDQFGYHGIAVGDVNGDELDDLYICDAGGLPNRLFIQQADGTALDVSAASGVDLLDNSVAALLIDLDNDGDQDLIVATDPALQLAENDGRGRFTWRRAIPVDTDPFSLCAADYDVDGDLDIYACGYDVRKKDPTNRGLPFPLPYHDANNGGRNLLLRNDGDFDFGDVTDLVGLDQNNSRFSMAAAWEDFDNDGDLDLYVANDFGRNNLYRNDAGRFTDIADAAGVEDHGSGMSVAWGDYNRDGWVDLYVGNMFSAAGNRVTYQQRFSQGISGRTVSHLRRMARGNSLFLNATTNAAAPQFRDVSVAQSVVMGRWAWASKFADLTNDGWPDLIVANGYLTNDDTSDL